MSSTRAKVVSQPMTFGSVETAFCTCCDAQIPSVHIARNLVPVKHGEIAPATRQTVRAWCSHCDTLYELIRELANGVWVIVSDIEIVKDAKRLASFKARLAHLRGDIQVIPQTEKEGA